MEEAREVSPVKDCDRRVVLISSVPASKLMSTHPLCVLKQTHRALFRATFASEMDINVPLPGGLRSPSLPLPKGISPPPKTSKHESKPSGAESSHGLRMLTFKDIDDWTSVPLVNYWSPRLPILHNMM